MSGSELRTYGLAAFVAVLLGAGIGFGWHYLIDGNGAGAAAAAVTPPAKQDTPILRCRALLRSERVQFLMSPRLQDYLTSSNRPGANRERALRAKRAGNTSHAVGCPPRPRSLILDRLPPLAVCAACGCARL